MTLSLKVLGFAWDSPLLPLVLLLPLGMGLSALVLEADIYMISQVHSFCLRMTQ